jgi:hypothetical protein
MPLFDNAYILKNRGGSRANVRPMDLLKPTRTHRYLYHFTEGGNRCKNEENLYFKRISIYLYGLYGKDKGTRGIWANRNIDRLNNIYPIILDGYEWGKEGYADGLESYDIWRIDTKLSENRWYIDPNMLDMNGFCDTNNFVYTENSILPNALKLFNVSIDRVHLYLNPNESVKFKLFQVKIK